jgi:hypothetical protein
MNCQVTASFQINAIALSSILAGTLLFISVPTPQPSITALSHSNLQEDISPQQQETCPSNSDERCHAPAATLREKSLHNGAHQLTHYQQLAQVPVCSENHFCHAPT